MVRRCTCRQLATSYWHRLPSSALTTDHSCVRLAQICPTCALHSACPTSPLQVAGCRPGACSLSSLATSSHVIIVSAQALESDNHSTTIQSTQAHASIASSIGRHPFDRAPTPSAAPGPAASSPNSISNQLKTFSGSRKKPTYIPIFCASCQRRGSLDDGFHNVCHCYLL